MPDLATIRKIYSRGVLSRQQREIRTTRKDHRPVPPWKACGLPSCANGNLCRYPEECAAKKEGSE